MANLLKRGRSLSINSRSLNDRSFTNSGISYLSKSICITYGSLTGSTASLGVSAATSVAAGASSGLGASSTTGV